MRKKVPTSKGCFVCGEDNPIGLKLETWIDGENVEATLAFGEEYTGWEKVVHGGIISTVLDEVMVWVPWVITGKYYFTGEMTVRFRKPLIAGTEVTAMASVASEKRGRVIETEAELKDAKGNVYATAKGKYISMRDDDAKEFERSLLK